MYNVLHLIQASLPVIAGYTIRTHNILINQKRFCNPIALTNKYFKRKNDPDFINRILYIRYPYNKIEDFLLNSSISKNMKLSPFFNIIYRSGLLNSTSFVDKISKTYKIELIHGHTPESFSKYGEKTARALKIPFVYEVRGFQEDTLLTYGNIKRNNRIYKKRKEKEKNIMKKADVLITLGNQMKNTLIDMNIDEEKIKIIPNGVDVDFFKPLISDVKLKSKYANNDSKIIGFIGTIRRLEGLEVLIKAFKRVNEENKHIILLIVGRYHEEYKLALDHLISILDLEDKVHFTGQIPFKDIKKFYSIIDIHVLPRIDVNVNRIVTPLKPLEVMAMSKPLISSKLPALEELIKPNISGEFFKPGDHLDLSEKLKFFLRNENKAMELGKKARKFVEKNYAWRNLAMRYKNIYESLLN